MDLLKRAAARLPIRWQSELKRIYFRRQIKNSEFFTDEPEYKILHALIKPGDWIIDIGANVGHYTKRFSELTGARGRVIAFEPMPETFSLLSANVELFAYRNVTLINAAVSDKLAIVGMSVPKFATGLTNYYEAQLAPADDNALLVLALPVDSLFLNQPIGLVKIDAEGHEAFVLAGMKKLIEEFWPVLIVETKSEKVIGNLVSMGYVPERLEKSPNVLFRPDR